MHRRQLGLEHHSKVKFMITTRQPLLVMLFLLGDVIAYCVLLYTTGLEQKKIQIRINESIKDINKTWQNKLNDFCTLSKKRCQLC